jgi:MFS family permease
LWIAGLFVFLAVNAQSIARAWLARELTGTNAGLGGVLLAFGLPSLLVSPWGGVAADRVSKRFVLVVAQLMLTAGALWVGIAVAFDVLAYWMLLANSAIQGVAFSMFGPARMAFTAELVEAKDLTNAVSIGQMSSEAMRVVGPSIAGILVAVGTVGEATVFIGGAVLSAVAMLATLRLPPGNPSPHRPTRSPMEELREGLVYVRDNHYVLLLVGASLGVVMIGFPYMAFLPSVADGLFDVGAGGYGLMSAVTSIGAITAALVAARRGAHADLWKRLVLSGFSFGVALVLLGLSPTFGVALLVLAAVGACGLLFQTSNQSLLLILSDFEYHGRVQGLLMLGFSGLGIAALPLGILADSIGLRQTLVLMGVASMLIVIFVALRGRRHTVLRIAGDFG